MQLLLWYGHWFWRYQVKHEPYSWQDASHLTRRSLGVPFESWRHIGTLSANSLPLVFYYLEDSCVLIWIWFIWAIFRCSCYCSLPICIIKLVVWCKSVSLGACILDITNWLVVWCLVSGTSPQHSTNLNLVCCIRWINQGRSCRKTTVGKTQLGELPSWDAERIKAPKIGVIYNPENLNLNILDGVELQGWILIYSWENFGGCFESSCSKRS